MKKVPFDEQMAEEIGIKEKRMIDEHMRIGKELSEQSLTYIQGHGDAYEGMAIYLQAYTNLLIGMMVSYTISTDTDVERVLMSTLKSIHDNVKAAHQQILDGGGAFTTFEVMDGKIVKKGGQTIQ